MSPETSKDRAAPPTLSARRACDTGHDRPASASKPDPIEESSAIDVPPPQRAILHGLFSLNEGVSEAEFTAAFAAFFEHLKEKGFARAFQVMQRQPLPGFGAGLPEFAYCAAVEFHDLACDQACDDYIAADEAPVRSLHRAMNSKMRRGSAHFFLSADVPPGGH